MEALRYRGCRVSAGGAQQCAATIEVLSGLTARLGDIAGAILFAGAAWLAQRFDGTYLTLSSGHAATRPRFFGVRGSVLRVQFGGWSPFTQNADSLHAAFAANGTAGTNSRHLLSACQSETSTMSPTISW